MLGAPGPDGCRDHAPAEQGDDKIESIPVEGEQEGDVAEEEVSGEEPVDDNVLVGHANWRGAVGAALDLSGEVEEVLLELQAM